TSAKLQEDTQKGCGCSQAAAHRRRTRTHDQPSLAASLVACRRHLFAVPMYSPLPAHDMKRTSLAQESARRACLLCAILSACPAAREAGEERRMKTKSAAKKLNKLFGKTAYAAATTRNYEGAPAFVRGDDEQLLRVLMTGSFEQTFYATDTELA